MLDDKDRLELEQLRAAVSRYEAPGGWRELMSRDAYRLLGDPSKGVSIQIVNDAPMMN